MYNFFGNYLALVELYIDPNGVCLGKYLEVESCNKSSKKKKKRENKKKLFD